MEMTFDRKCAKIKKQKFEVLTALTINYIASSINLNLFRICIELLGLNGHPSWVGLYHDLRLKNGFSICLSVWVCEGFLQVAMTVTFALHYKSYFSSRCNFLHFERVGRGTASSSMK